MTNNLVIRYHHNSASLPSLTTGERNAHDIVSQWLQTNEEAISNGSVTYEDYYLKCKENKVKAYFTSMTFNKCFAVNHA